LKKTIIISKMKFVDYVKKWLIIYKFRKWNAVIKNAKKYFTKNVFTNTCQWSKFLNIKLVKMMLYINSIVKIACLVMPAAQFAINNLFKALWSKIHQIIRNAQLKNAWILHIKVAL
jgi:hypothetical protein